MESAVVTSTTDFQEATMNKLFEIGGFVAATILVLFGAAVIALGVDGRSTVNSSLADEAIVGTPDMTPALTRQAVAEAGLKGVSIPSCSVADEAITTGGEARCFAQYMRIHTLEGSGGMTYAQMPRYATADGKGTNDAAKALTSESGQPTSNPARNVWVTETALATALNVGYMASQLALFSIVIGIALLLTGVGFAVLSYAALHRRRAEATGEPETKTATRVATA
jgi:hypothetical protein